MTSPALRVTVEDLETGEVETTELKAGEHVVVCVEPAYLHYVQRHPTTGTTTVTIRRRPRV